ncbi:MAG: hypothetical protein J0M12_11295 [Deltaproteobacteria bacterium]|nr:hypothetical protein [Deltaproteobacteria bacterium]
MFQALKTQLDAHRESSNPMWKVVDLARETARDLRYALAPSTARLTLPFSGDDILATAMADFCTRVGARVIVETGTNVGATTAALARMAPRVLTIEANAKFVNEARNNLREFSNIEIFHGDSGEVLPAVLLNETGPALFFLDAHWGRRWPLLAELKAIAAAEIFTDSVIIIHDMHVPDRDFGYDVYGGKRLDLSYVRESLLKINPEFEHSYPTEANGARRGWVAIHPRLEGTVSRRITHGSIGDFA